MNDQEKSKQALIDELIALRMSNQNLKDELSKNTRAYETCEIFRNIIEASNEAISISGKAGNLIYANRSHQKLFGTGPGKELHQIIDDYVQNGSLIQSEMYNDTILPDEWVPVLEHVSFPVTIGETEFFASILHDVTELKQAEEAYRMLVDYSLQGYIILQKNGIIFANDVISELIGYTLEELKGFPKETLFERTIHPEDCDRMRQLLEDSLKGIPHPQRHEFKCITKCGEVKWIEANIRLIKIQGQPALQAAIIDITDRKRAEELVRYKFLLDKVGDGVILLDEECRFIEANDCFLEKAGISRKQLTGRSFLDFVPKDQLPFIQRKKMEILREHRKQFELYLIFDDLSRIPFEINCQLVNYLGSNCFLCVSRDITEKKLLQDQLILSERLSATGQLAASVAHELNSPLQAITVMLSLMNNSSVNNFELKENIALLADAFQSIQDTVKNLLDLNRSGHEKKQMININRILSNTVDLVRSHLKSKKILVELDLSNNIPEFFGSSQ